MREAEFREVGVRYRQEVEIPLGIFIDGLIVNEKMQKG